VVLTDIGKIAIYEKSEDVPFVTINSHSFPIIVFDNVELGALLVLGASETFCEIGLGCLGFRAVIFLRVNSHQRSDDKSILAPFEVGSSKGGGIR